jgi:hypothetical protein
VSISGSGRLARRSGTTRSIGWSFMMQARATVVHRLLQNMVYAALTQPEK